MVLEKRMEEMMKLPEAEAVRRMIDIENLMRHNLSSVRKRLFAIEGNIGTGKSTLANLLGARVGIKPFLENVDGNPIWAAIIEQFYKDRKKFGFSTQLALLHARRGQASEAFYYPASASLDRTYFGDRFVFIPTLVDEGLPKSDVDKLEEEYEKFRDEFPPIDLLFLLNSSPQTAYRRLMNRSRAVEARTDLVEDEIDENHYLVKIGKRYDAFPGILKEKGLYEGPVIYIDQDKVKLTEGRHVTALLEEMAEALAIK